MDHSPHVFVLVSSVAIASAGEKTADLHLHESAVFREALPLVAKWEGKRNKAYVDAVGVLTICYGSTKSVHRKMTMSDLECLERLHNELSRHRSGIHAYFSPYTKSKRLTIKRDAAFTSLAYNVGVHRAGSSTATSRLNAGNILGACEALTWFNQAGGRIIKGLINRRKEERALCLHGLP